MRGKSIVSMINTPDLLDPELYNQKGGFGKPGIDGLNP
jgi:hypothetical protein